MALQAFDIVHAANLSALFKDKIQINSNVTCLEICGDYLFIGFREGTILRCRCTKAKNYDFLSELTHSQHMSHNQSITKLKSISALNQLLVLSDESLTVLDLETLDLVRHLKFKNVSTFCLNEDPVNEDPFTVEIAVAIKKKIQYVYMNDEGIRIIKDFPAASGPPVAMAMDGVHICFSSGLEYCMLDILTGEIQQLFSRDLPEQIPIIQRVSKGEFLLSGPGGLGVFASTEGISERPPIGFSGYISSLAFHHPYIMGLTTEGIQIYSSTDQQCKQIIGIPNVRCLVDGDGQIYAATSIDLFALCPISWQAQVERLIIEDRIDEALQLAINARISSGDKEQHRLMVLELQRKAAFQNLKACNFNQAMELYEASQIDCREILKINLEETFDDSSVSQGRQFILNFLERRRSAGLSSEEKNIVDAALLAYYARDDEKSTALLNLIKDCEAGEEEVISILQSHKRFHCLAVYYIIRHNFSSAFTVWNRLIKTDDEDSQFPGCDVVIEELIKCSDWSLIWRFSGELLKKDQCCAAKIFTETYKKHEVDADAVCDFLKPYLQTLGLFLHFLVYDRKVESSSIHTRLALHYIEQITSLHTDQRISSSPVHRSMVNKLRALLRTSSYLDLKQLSTALNAPHFPHENAIVLGRLGDHTAAINIFIRQLKDFDAAEEYCACIDEADAWNSLLSVCVALESQGATVDRLVDLLRRRPNEFDVMYALQHLPDDTKIDAVAPYVKFAIREALHLKRTKLVQRALSSMDKLDKQITLTRVSNEAFSLQAASYCCVCKKRFSLSDGVARYPNGVVTHARCANNHHICPLTGHMFQIETCQATL